MPQVHCRTAARTNREHVILAESTGYHDSRPVSTLNLVKSQKRDVTEISILFDLTQIPVDESVGILQPMIRSHFRDVTEILQIVI
jgi:hypothetical protein